MTAARCFHKVSSIFRRFSISNETYRCIHSGPQLSSRFDLPDVKDEDDLYVENQIEDDIGNSPQDFRKKDMQQRKQKGSIQKKVDENYRRFIKSNIIKKKERKLYDGPKMPNLLTYAARAQIVHLHEEDPIYWTPEMLADSFPANPYAIKEILRTFKKRRPIDEWEIYKHDQRVYNNWLKLRQAQLEEGGPIDPAYRLLVASEKVGLMVNAAGARSLPMPDLKKALLTQRELAEQLKPKVAPIFSSLLEEGKGRQLGNTSNTPQGREQTTHGRFGNHKGRDFSGPFGGEGNIASPENDGPESNFNDSDCERLLKEISQQAGGTDENYTYKDNSEESESNRNNLSANLKHLKDKTRINKSSLSYTKDDYAVLDTPNNMRMKKSNSGIYNDSLDSKTLKFSHKIKDESVKRVKSMYGKQRKTTTRSNLVEEKNLFGVEGEKNSEEREDEISAALSGGLEDIDILSRDKRKVLGSRLRIRRRDKIEDE